MAMDQRKLGNLALVTVAFAWGTMVPVISHLAHTWDPFFLGAVRYVCGVPLLFAALWMTEGFARPAVRPAVWRALVPGWLGLGGFAFIFTIGIAHANPVIAAVLGAANPVIAAVIGGVIFRIPFDRRLAPAVVLAVVGCAFASIDWSGGGFSLELRGGEPAIVDRKIVRSDMGLQIIGETVDRLRQHVLVELPSDVRHPLGDRHHGADRRPAARPAHRSDVGLAEFPQRGFSIAPGIEIVCDPALFERFGLEDRFEQPALVSEVDIERALGDARRTRNFVHARPIKAQIHEHLSRAVQNLAAL